MDILPIAIDLPIPDPANSLNWGDSNTDQKFIEYLNYALQPIDADIVNCILNKVKNTYIYQDIVNAVYAPFSSEKTNLQNFIKQCVINCTIELRIDNLPVVWWTDANGNDNIPVKTAIKSLFDRYVGFKQTISSGGVNTDRITNFFTDDQFNSYYYNMQKVYNFDKFLDMLRNNNFLNAITVEAQSLYNFNQAPIQECPPCPDPVKCPDSGAECPKCEDCSLRGLDTKTKIEIAVPWIILGLVILGLLFMHFYTKYKVNQFYHNSPRWTQIF